jgi:hypothetical protein
MIVKNLSVAIVALVLLTGCVPMMQAAQRQKQIEAQQAQQQRNNDRTQQAAAEANACVQKRKDHIFKTYAESADCVSDAVERGFRETNYPYMDLIVALNARRSQLAAEMDKKKITEEDFKAGMAEKMSEITSEELKRNSQLASTAAAQQQANAAQRAATAQTISAFAQSQAAQAQQQTMRFAPTPVAPTLRSTNCTTNAIGQTLQTNCTGY